MDPQQQGSFSLLRFENLSIKGPKSPARDGFKAELATLDNKDVPNANLVEELLQVVEFSSSNSKNNDSFDDAVKLMMDAIDTPDPLQLLEGDEDDMSFRLRQSLQDFQGEVLTLIDTVKQRKDPLSLEADGLKNILGVKAFVIAQVRRILYHFASLAQQRLLVLGCDVAEAFKSSVLSQTRNRLCVELSTILHVGTARCQALNLQASGDWPSVPTTPDSAMTSDHESEKSPLESPSGYHSPPQPSWKSSDSSLSLNEQTTVQSTRVRNRQGSRHRLTSEARKILERWLNVNLQNPYPSNEQKNLLAAECGISAVQVNNWMMNARSRRLKVKRVGISSASDS